MRGGGGGGAGREANKFLSFFSYNFFLNVFFWGGGGLGVIGVPHGHTRGSRGVGKRYTSSYDHDP